MRSGMLYVQPQTCQCTQCRKGCGTLVAHYITVPTSQIEWTHTANSFKLYHSSQNAYRGFCAECGSTLTWQGEELKGEGDGKGDGEVEVVAGSVDERWLVGEGGKEGVGRELCTTTGGNLWCRNEIKGVTDGMVKGRKFEEESKSVEFRC